MTNPFEFELRVSVHHGLMNKIPTRCSKFSLFSSFFSLHVSGATFTHHQEPQLYTRVWCHCINRLCGWAKCVPNPDQLYGRCESEMSPVNVSEPDCPALTRLQATSDLDLAHTPPSHTNGEWHSYHCIPYNLQPILPRRDITILVYNFINNYTYIVIADLYSDTIPACTVQAPDDGWM
jgi:hypothetical protein